MCMYIYICIHVYTYMYIYIYTYIYMYACRSSHGGGASVASPAASRGSPSRLLREINTLNSCPKRT